MKRLFIHLITLLMFWLHAGQACSQEMPQTDIVASDVQPLEDRLEGEAERVTEETSATSPETARHLHEGIVLTFVLLMFTNAIQCGQWAIQTKRHFWAWYLAGLFTGPLAGGVMLQRTAVDTIGDANPGGCGGALAGLLIPAAGWFIWLAILL